MAQRGSEMITDLFYGLLDITICPNCSKVVTFLELVAPCPHCGLKKFLDDWIDDWGWCRGDIGGCEGQFDEPKILAPCPHCGYQADSSTWMAGLLNAEIEE